MDTDFYVNPDYNIGACLLPKVSSSTWINRFYRAFANEVKDDLPGAGQKYFPFLHTVLT